MINTSHLQKEEDVLSTYRSKKYTVDSTNSRDFEPDFPKEDPDKRKYSVKAVKSGNFVQVYEYRRARTTAKPGTSKKTNQGRKESVRMDNIYRATTACKRLINANRDRGKDSDKFGTFTFAEDTWTDLKAVNYEVHKFIMRLEYELKIKVRYVCVPQIQWERYEKYGVKVWHLHIYFFGLPYIANKRLREIWGHGFVRINAIDKDSDVGSYVARYMEKDFSSFQEKGMRRFHRSSGLLEPEEIRAESFAQILGTMDLPEECKVYGPVTYLNNTMQGVVTYSLYNLGKQEVSRNGKEISDTEETTVSHSTSRFNSV